MKDKIILTKPKVLFLLHQVGPYHHARFENLQQKVDLTVLEIHPHSNEYSWNTDNHGSYEKQALLPSNKKKQLRALVKTKNWDAIINCGWSDVEYHYMALLGRKSRVKCVLISDSREVDQQRVQWKEWVKTNVLKLYDAAIVAGEQSKDYLVKLGYEKRNISAPWDVVDNDFYSRENDNYVEFDQRYFLCVARLISKKNLAKLILAFSNYLKQGGQRKLFIAGDGELKKELDALIIQNGLNANVHMCGFVQYGELKALYHKAFCLIFPSITDQWGLVVNEAMAASLPVLMTKECGAFHDLCIPDIKHYSFNPLEMLEMQKAMIKADELDVANWDKIGSASRDFITKKYSLNHFTEAVLHAVLDVEIDTRQRVVSTVMMKLLCNKLN